MRWLQTSHHWAAYVSGQHATYKMSASSAAPPPDAPLARAADIGEGQARVWLTSVLPHVHMARASLLRLLRLLLGGAPIAEGSSNVLAGPTRALLTRAPLLHAIAPALVTTIATPTVDFHQPPKPLPPHLIRNGDPDVVASLLLLAPEPPAPHDAPGRYPMHTTVAMTPEGDEAADEAAYDDDDAGGTFITSPGTTGGDFADPDAHLSPTALRLAPSPHHTEVVEAMLTRMIAAGSNPSKAAVAPAAAASAAAASAAVHAAVAASVDAAYSPQLEALRLWSLLLQRTPEARPALLACQVRHLPQHLPNISPTSPQHLPIISQ